MEYRYPHCLRKVGDGRWPEIVICVSVNLSPRKEVGRRVFYAESLASWSALVLTKQEGIYRYCRNCAGAAAESFWPLLSAAVGNHYSALILSQGCGRIWPLLGLYEELENGRILLDSDGRQPGSLAQRGVPDVRQDDAHAEDDADTGRDLSGMSPRFSGYLVACGSCHATSFTFRNLGCRFRWLDTHNWGVTLPDSDRQTASITDLASLFIDMAALLPRHQLPAPRNTAASMVLHALKGEYMTDAIWIHNHKEALVLEEAAYHGGRVECFRLGKLEPPWYHYDFRSAYAWIGVNTELPVRLECVLATNAPAAFPNSFQATHSIATVEVETDEPAYPYWRDGQTIFPVGTFWTTLCGPELEDAVRRKRVRRVQAWATYQLAPCLRAVMTALYNLRLQAEELGSKPLAQLAKKMIVACHGKLGQRRRMWVDCDNHDASQPYDRWPGKGPDGKPCWYRSVAWHVQREVEDGFAPEAAPAIAAWVCSAARMRLLEAIRCAGWRNVAYCATDSLFVNGAGQINLQNAGWIAEGGLGKLQLKSAPAKLEIRGLNYYVEDGKVVCAGLPLQDRIDPADESGYWHAVTESEHINAGVRPDAQQRRQSYARFEGYTHGILGPDGIVRPIALPEE